MPQLDRSRAAGDHAGWTELQIRASPDLLDRLLVEDVAPIVAAGADGKAGARAFFLRERVGGTWTLRVWVDAAGPSVHRMVRALREDAEDGGGAVELSVVPGAKFDATEGRYEGPDAEELFTELFVRASPYLLEQLEAIVEGRVDRRVVALDMLVAQLPAVDIADAFPDRYPFAREEDQFPASFPVYRAHADGLIIMSPDPDAARAKLDAQYERWGDAIRRRTDAVLSQLAGGATCSRRASRWYDVARGNLLRAESAIRHGRLEVVWDEGRIGDSHDLSPSAYHETASESEALQSFLRTDPGYLAARATMSGLYLALGALGLRVVDRMVLCHCICRACEELFSEDATSILEGLSHELERHGGRGGGAA